MNIINENKDLVFLTKEEDVSFNFSSDFAFRYNGAISLPERMPRIDNNSYGVDSYVDGTSVLYTPPLKVYDLPNSNTSLHIHGSNDGNTLYGGSIKELGTNVVLKKLNGYDCSMLDSYANALNLPNKMDR